VIVSTDSPLTPRFRLVAYLEGASFLILLFIAMPLKYWAGFPIAVRVVGLAHGLLFLAYAVAVLQAVTEDRFSLGTGVKAFIASLLPFGPFVFEARLKRRLASR
jgi:integral membrane protein